MSFYINCKNLAVKIFFSDNGEALMDTWLTQGLCSYFGPNKCVGKTNMIVAHQASFSLSLSFL